MKRSLRWHPLLWLHYIRVATPYILRNKEIYIRAKLALRHRGLLDALIKQVGSHVMDATRLFSGASWSTFGKAGYCDAHNYEGARTICWEAPVGILVYLADRPALGLGIEFRGKALCIRQMQGAPGLSLPKTLNNWPQIFVHACTKVAEANGLREVRIYKADQSLNYRVPILEPKGGQTYTDAAREHRRRMRRRYDGTARSLKFTEKEKYWAWRNPAYGDANGRH